MRGLKTTQSVILKRNKFSGDRSWRGQEKQEEEKILRLQEFE